MYLAEIKNLLPGSVLDLTGKYLFAVELPGALTPAGLWEYRKSSFHFFADIHIMTLDEMSNHIKRTRLSPTDIVIFKLTREGFSQCNAYDFVLSGDIITDKVISWGRFGYNLMLHQMIHYPSECSAVTCAYQFLHPSSEEADAMVDKFNELNKRNTGIFPATIHSFSFGHIMNGVITTI